MTKKELSEQLNISQVTVSRYMAMGLPYEKARGKCQFDLDEVIQWRRDNIMPTYRTNNPPGEKVPTSKEIASWALNFSLALLNFLQNKCCKKCQAKWLHDVEIGKFYVDEV
ncbi:MAG: hypothetical protein IT392_01135 [Nitrospirae bacterium]|nr:hypothetical protein [Nitrospirota bacterium]